MLEFGIGERKETFRAEGDRRGNAGKGGKGRKNRITFGKYCKEKGNSNGTIATMSATCVMGNT